MLFASRNKSCGAFHRIKPLYLIKRKINMISFCFGFEHIFVKIYIATDDKICSNVYEKSNCFGFEHIFVKIYIATDDKICSNVYEKSKNWSDSSVSVWRSNDSKCSLRHSLVHYLLREDCFLSSLFCDKKAEESN